jgi:hypothetical protein
LSPGGELLVIIIARQPWFPNKYGASQAKMIKEKHQMSATTTCGSEKYVAGPFDCPRNKQAFKKEQK